MSNLKTESFEFYTFDQNDERHQKALILLEEDPQIQRWFGDFGKFFYENASEVSTDLEGKYLVGRGEDIIGFVCLHDYFKYIDLDYGLLPSFRGIKTASNQTVGSKLLLETAETILRDHADVEYLRCYIDLNNIRSISAAKKAGFTCHKELIIGYAEYHKSREL